MSRERKESKLEGESGGGVGSGSVPIGGWGSEVCVARARGNNNSLVSVGIR